MQTITTTQLRTNTKSLTTALLEGKTIKLIHRSKIIGNIKPVSHKKPTKKLSFSQSIKKAQKAFTQTNISLPKDNKGLMQVYADRLKEKYG